MAEQQIKTVKALAADLRDYLERANEGRPRHKQVSTKPKRMRRLARQMIRQHQNAQRVR